MSPYDVDSLVDALKEALDGWEEADAMADSEFHIESIDGPCKVEARIAELREQFKSYLEPEG